MEVEDEAVEPDELSDEESKALASSFSTTAAAHVGDAVDTQSMSDQFPMGLAGSFTTSGAALIGYALKYDQGQRASAIAVLHRPKRVGTSMHMDRW